MDFGKDFIWGAATASYQIEGAANKDGRGLSVWDIFCKNEGKVYGEQSGEIACDHYHRYKEDVKLMKEIGLQAYRFSLSWSRILPEGVGKVNQKGLDFYDRLVDELLKNNIEPYITLFHWDFPYELYKKGGWLNADSSEWFAEYAEVVAKRLSDRVKNFMTQNESVCFISHGHKLGVHAPGLQLPWDDVLLSAHNSLLAHGKAVMALRSHGKQALQIGYAPTGTITIPKDETPSNIELARKKMFEFSEKNLWIPSFWLDPIIFGQYSKEVIEVFGEDMPRINDEDMKIINQPLDNLGFNIYTGTTVGEDKNGQSYHIKNKVGRPHTDMGWGITPKSLYYGPKFLSERYNLPVLITENGMANLDWVNSEGKIHDPQRIEFIKQYLRECKRAKNDGVNVKGYFLWSLMDNFEWAEGYEKRFGIIHVDYETQKRTFKDSAYWYKSVIETNGGII